MHTCISVIYNIYDRYIFFYSVPRLISNFFIAILQMRLIIKKIRNLQWLVSLMLAYKRILNI